MPRFSTLIRSSTLRVAGAVAAIAVTAPLTAPAVAKGGVEEIPCGRDRRIEGLSSIWQSFPAPRFGQPAGVDEAVPQQITSFAVSPKSSKVVAVTNGSSVYMSYDGGCSWSLGFRIDQTIENPNDDPTDALSSIDTRIHSLFISASGAVFALAEQLDNDASVGRLQLLRSPQGAANTWTYQNDGLPPIGRPLIMAGHRTHLGVLYLTVSGARDENVCATVPLPGLPCDQVQPGKRLGLIWASTDGGLTWSSRTDTGDLGNGVSVIRHVSVDDDDPAGNKVWVVANGLLRLSTNGGRTFEVPPGLEQTDFRFTAVASLSDTRESGTIKLVAFGEDQEMLRLQDGKWVRTQVPFNTVQSVAQRETGDIAVATDPGSGERARANVWRIYPGDFHDFDLGINLAGRTFKGTFGWESIQPSTVLPVTADVGAGAGSASYEGTFYVRDTGRVLRFIASVARLPETPAERVNLDPLAPPMGKITPANVTLDLPLGKSTTVDYTLTLPPSPTPLDVYLIVDNSGSMIPTIDGLKKNLHKVATRLRDLGVDVAVGLGQVNVEPTNRGLPVDDPVTRIDEGEPKPLYQRLRAIGRVDDNLFDQLETLDGNGGQGKEAQIEALYQAVTGEGLDFNGLGWLTGYQIEKGQEAGFREALSPIKVIVHATDENFREDITNGHSFAEAIAALKNSNVKQIGLSQGMDEAATDLARVAKETGALAPAGGTDCDGDGRITYADVPAGKPLVCGVSTGLDKTLLNLLGSLRDFQVINLQTRKTPTMAHVSSTSFSIDAKDETKRTFTVTYTCKGLSPGQYVNDMNASLRGILIAKASAVVNCGGVAIPPNPPPAVEPAVNPPPPQPQPLVPAPAPVNPAPQPQTQVQTQVNPQAGMAEQEEEQFELATALNELGFQDDEQLAMSRLAYEDNPAVVLTLGMALTSALGVGVAVRRRTRTATAKASVRR